MKIFFYFVFEKHEVTLGTCTFNSRGGGEAGEGLGGRGGGDVRA